MVRKFSTHKKGGIFKAASNYVTAVVPCDSFTRWVGISYLRPPTQGRLNYLQGEILLSGFLQLSVSRSDSLGFGAHSLQHLVVILIQKNIVNGRIQNSTSLPSQNSSLSKKIPKSLHQLHYTGVHDLFGRV